MSKPTSSVRVMLADEAELDGSLTYPLIALPKHNGIRGIGLGGVYSRTLTPIPNKHVQARFAADSKLECPPDGELVVEPYGHEEVYNRTFSGVMSEDAVAEVSWYIFDVYHKDLGFEDRLRLRDKLVAEHKELGLGEHMHCVPWWVVHSDAEAQEKLDWALANGYEGLVLRSPTAKYKQGRSTKKEQGLLRLVPWLRSEAVITAIEELQVNNNESVPNALGLKKKAKIKENIVGAGVAGTFIMRDLKTNKVVSVLVQTEALQKEVWDNKDSWIGRIVKYKFKKPVKIGGAPRHPQYEGPRDLMDM